MANPPNTPNGVAPDALLIAARQAAKVLGISTRLLWSMTNARQIPHVRVRRRVLYDPLDLRAWIDANKTEARR